VLSILEQSKSSFCIQQVFAVVATVVAMVTYLRSRYSVTAVVYLLFPRRCLATGLYATIYLASVSIYCIYVYINCFQTNHTTYSHTYYFSMPLTKYKIIFERVVFLFWPLKFYRYRSFLKLRLAFFGLIFLVLYKRNMMNLPFLN
jgi:hypothetical protein